MQTEVDDDPRAVAAGGGRPDAGRFTVRAGGREVVVLRRWPRGFSVDAGEAGHLPGRVDLYEGRRHVCQALVVAMREEAGERVFEFKYATPVADSAPSPDCVAGPPAAF